MFKRVLVYGLGLLGGSICKSLKNNSPETYIIACGRNPKKIEAAIQDKVVDEIISYEDDFPENLDLVIVAVPVEKSISLIKQVLSQKLLKKDVLVIDVGSVKEEIVNEIETHENSDRFIGCHPMAGSEKSGYQASYDTLYKSASVIITPHKKNNNKDIEKINRFWQELGANCINVAAKEHDKAVSITSHLPHMIASTLVNLLSKNAENLGGLSSLLPFIGNGFKDVTRIAEGSVEIWKEIAKMNKENIIDSIENYIELLNDLKQKINSNNENGQLDTFLKEAIDTRKEIRK